MFEVDHPATQEWKRRALGAAGVRVPENLTFVSADLTAQPLAPRLQAAGFDDSAPVLVSWLGVTMYLTPEAVAATLTALGGFAPGTEVIADFMLPEDLRDEAGAIYGKLVAQSAAERGEPWLSSFTPGQMTGLARACGLAEARTVRQRDTIPAALWERTDALRPADLAVLLHAAVTGG